MQHAKAPSNNRHQVQGGNNTKNLCPLAGETGTINTNDKTWEEEGKKKKFTFLKDNTIACNKKMNDVVPQRARCCCCCLLRMSLSATLPVESFHISMQRSYTTKHCAKKVDCHFCFFFLFLYFVANILFCTFLFSFFCLRTHTRTIKDGKYLNIFLHFTLFFIVVLILHVKHFPFIVCGK